MVSDECRKTRKNIVVSAFKHLTEEWRGRGTDIMNIIFMMSVGTG